MIEIKKPNTPEGYISCYSCGNKDNDVTNISVYESVVIKGKTRRVSGNIYGLTLCKKCREELRELLSQ